MTITIQLNGESQAVPQSCTIADLINELSLEKERIAVEVNQEIVPRSTFVEHQLNAEDKVEIVRAIGGG